MKYFSTFVLLVLLVLMPVTPVYAGNGKIAGVVKDATGKPIPGANILIQGTVRGASADAEGRYFILDVPPGIYSIAASAVGYERKIYTGVKVSADMTTELNVELREAAVAVPEVVVEAERPLVDRTLTATRSTITTAELNNTLPVANVFEVLATSAGVYRSFVRGGRQYETKTVIDGVDVTDQFYAVVGDQLMTPYQGYNAVTRQAESQRSISVNITPSSIQEANVNTSVVNADYSSSSAGLINFSLKEGKGSLSGKAFFRMSGGGLKHKGPNVYNDESLYFTERDNWLKTGKAADSLKASLYTYKSGMYDYGNKPQIEGELSLGGEVMKDLGFYFTGKLFNSYGRFPNEFTRTVDLTLKANYNLTPDIRLTAVGIVSDNGKLFGWKNRNYQETYRYYLQGVPQWNAGSWVGSLKLTHFLSPNTFYEVQVSNKNDAETRGFSDVHWDATLGRYVIDLNGKGDFITFADTATTHTLLDWNQKNSLAPFSVNPGNEAFGMTSFTTAGMFRLMLARPGIFYENFKSNVLTVKADFTSQVTFNHQIKAGGQFRLHSLDMTRRASFIGGPDANIPYHVETWQVWPKEMGFYAQDRMEYAGLIINLGARLDYWDPAATDYGNYFMPYVADSAYYDGGKFAQRDEIRGRAVGPYWLFSPRLGVSHPISDNAALYFSFSRQFQPPPFSRIYTNYLANDFGSMSLPNGPSIRQEPITSTNYELGVQWEFLRRMFGLNVNAYYRDINNYGTLAFGVTPNPKLGALYYIQTSFGYADARGVELTLEKLATPVTDFLTVWGRLTYTYSYIKAAGFVGVDATQQTAFAWAAGDSARLAGNLPFDDIKYYNTIETNVQGGVSTLNAGYDRTHQIKYTLFLRLLPERLAKGLTLPIDVTLSSIGTFQSGFKYPLTLADPRVAGRELAEAPWNKQVDIRLELGFNFSGRRLGIYADVKNVFDWENIIAYDRTQTGQVAWERTGDPTGDPAGTSHRPMGYDGSMFYDIPREFFFGAYIEF